jgi:hypothetical protein
MKKQLLNRKRLMQLALSLCLILVSANSSWGQTPITVPNGDFSAQNVFLNTGTNPYTVINGWTVNAATPAGVTNLTASTSGVVSGVLYLKGTASTNTADVVVTSNPNNQIIQGIDISAIPLGTTFTATFPFKAATNQNGTPHQTRIKLYDANGIDVTSECSASTSNSNIGIVTNGYTDQVNIVSIRANNLGGNNAKYIALQMSIGKNLAAGLYVDNITLSYISNPPVLTVGTPSGTSLSYEIGAGPSAAQSFTVGVTNATANLTVTPGTNVELSSTSATSGFQGGGVAISLPAFSGTVATTTIYARLVAGLTIGTGGTNATKLVTIGSTGTTNQTIQFTASVNGINTSGITGSALSYVTGSGPSAEGSFTVTTNGLTSDLVVTPGSDLEVSTTSGTGFQSAAITLVNTTTSQIIYSRLKAGLSAGSYSGASTAVVVSSTGFTNVTKQFTGTITDPPTTWNGTSWSNTSGPTTSIDAIIDGNFSTTASGVTAGFTAKTLTVNATRSFTINSDHNITVAGAITNNGTITIENNANLVQTAVANNNSGSGTAIVKRNSASIQLYDYTLWSSPVAGQNLKAFSPETLDSRFYTYNFTDNLYNMVSNPAATTFSPATGYLIRAPNTWAAATPNTFNGVFTGVPNNGNISLSASALASNKFYAVGNPYPSTISADLFLSGNATGGTLYFWRKINNATTTPTTSYATYTLAGGVGTTNSGDPLNLEPNGTIQVGQGFIVKTGPSTEILNFTNAMRTSSNTSPFLRTTEERSRFWLNLTSTTGAFCQTMVAYMPEATSGVDNAIDGRYFNDSPIALTSIINTEEYTIQGRAMPFSTLDTVPLGFKTDAAGNYTIAIDHVDGLFSTGQDIYLKDNLLNTVNNLSAGSYSFASAIGTFNSRFELVYQSTLAETNPTFTANSVIAFNDNGDIRINSGSTIMELVRVYDLLGRLLVEKKQINSSETKLSTTATNQVLLLEITAANGTKVTKKIIQ